MSLVEGVLGDEGLQHKHISLCQPWHLSHSPTGYTIYAVLFKKPYGGRALALTQALAVCQHTTNYILICTDVDVIVVMLVAHTAHLIHMPSTLQSVA